jgi:branched-chain amino acid transport system substrate-binding protein
MATLTPIPPRISKPGPLLALCAIAAAVGCSRRSPAEERAHRAGRDKGEITVAAVWPWQGHADMGYREGLQMALEEVNRAGGIGGRPLRLQLHDDRSSLDEGTIIAQRIASDPSVVAVIGHLQSYVTGPAAAIYELAGLLMIAPTSTDPTLTTQGYHRVFQATFTDRDTGRQLAEFAQVRFRKVAICYIRNAYGRGLANAFEERANELGLSIAARQSYDPGEQVSARTFEPIVQPWKSLELDAVFLAGEVPSAALFVSQARAQGLSAQIFGGDALSSPGLLSIAGEAAEGVIAASFFHPDEPRAEVKRFTAAFQTRRGAVPDAGAAIGYDVIHLLARAMRHAGSVAPDQVARALRELPPWSGVTGSFRFDQQGAAVGKKPVMLQVQRGRFEHLDNAISASSRP